MVRLVAGSVIRFGPRSTECNRAPADRSRMRCRFLNPPTPDQEPKREDQFPGKGDRDEGVFNTRKTVTSFNRPNGAITV